MSKPKFGRKIAGLAFSLVICMTLAYVGTSLLGVNLLPTERNVYEATGCLRDTLLTSTDADGGTESTEVSMSTNEIAAIYRSSCVSVLSKFSSTSISSGSYSYALGSGVCVATPGYTTESGYTITGGSFFVTNYHVISYSVESDYSSYDRQTTIYIDNLEEEYEVDVVWYDKDLDLALLYCDYTDNGISQSDTIAQMQYIPMKDRLVACSSEDALAYDEIFTIGTPLSLSYQNTFTTGYVSNYNSFLTGYTTETVYITSSNGGYKTTTNSSGVSGMSSTSATVVSNVYEDIVMMNVDISSGNSGGGVFDADGYLIGLATLSLSYSSANTNSMNFAVSIYAVTQVLDRLIENQENSTSYKLYSMESIGLCAADANEIAYITYSSSSGHYYVTLNSSKYYYLDGNLYSSSLAAFDFEDDGVVVLSSSDTTSSLSSGFVITSAKIYGASTSTTIDTRNDLIYFLLSCDTNAKIILSGYDISTNSTASYTIQL